MTDIPENRETVMTDSAPDNRTALLVEMSHDLGIHSMSEKRRFNPPNPLKKGEQESKSPFLRGI
jgi:hypothetical protein